MYSHLRVGSVVTFDVRGFKRGKITKIFQIDGVTYCSIMTSRRGFVEMYARVGLPRINVLSDNGATT